MSLPGMKKNILRVIGKIINIVVLALLLINNFTEFGNIFPLSSIFLLVGTVFLAAQFYIEKDFWDDHRKILMVLIVLITFIPVAIEIALKVTAGSQYLYLFLGVAASQYMVVFVEQYSLSIYKNEKSIFVVFSILIEILLSLYQIMAMKLIILLLFAQILLLGAVIMILQVEAILKKEKLLNYI
ncbi:MAG: hypothetical protein ACTSRZ_01050 [Promethearchaeota archaeon]